MCYYLGLLKWLVNRAVSVLSVVVVLLLLVAVWIIEFRGVVSSTRFTTSPVPILWLWNVKAIWVGQVFRYRMIPVVVCVRRFSWPMMMRLWPATCG